jgi:hypothetical protein
MPVVAVPTSTECLSHRTFIYSTPVPLYLHLLNACPAIPTSTQCLSCSTQKKGRIFFRIMKSEELMAGEDSEPAGTCSELAGTHFTIGKIKFLWKFLSSKGLELK